MHIDSLHWNSKLFRFGRSYFELVYLTYTRERQGGPEQKPIIIAAEPTNCTNGFQLVRNGLICQQTSKHRTTIRKNYLIGFGVHTSFKVIYN